MAWATQEKKNKKKGLDKALALWYIVYMNKHKAHRIAMRQVIDKGRDPVALIDGLIQFLENHHDGSPFKTVGGAGASENILSELRELNEKLDRLEVVELGKTAYYADNKDARYL